MPPPASLPGASAASRGAAPGEPSAASCAGGALHAFPLSHAQGNIHDASVSCGTDILQIDGKAREAPGLAHARARFKASGPSARGAFEIPGAHLRLPRDANGALKGCTRLEREFAY